MQRLRQFFASLYQRGRQHPVASLLIIVGLTVLMVIIAATHHGSGRPNLISGWMIFWLVAIRFGNAITNAARTAASAVYVRVVARQQQRAGQQGQQQGAAAQPAAAAPAPVQLIPPQQTGKLSIGVIAFFFARWIWQYTSWLTDQAGWTRFEAVVLLGLTAVLGILMVQWAMDSTNPKNRIKAAGVLAGLMALWFAADYVAQGGINFLPKSGKSNVVYCKVDGEEFRADRRKWKACPEHGKTIVKKQKDVPVFWCPRDSSAYIGEVWTGRSVSRNDTLFALIQASPESRKALEFSHHLQWRRPQAELAAQIGSFLGMDRHSSKTVNGINLVLKIAAVVFVLSLLAKFGIVPASWMDRRLLWVLLIGGGFVLLRFAGPGIQIPKDVWHPTTQTWVVGRAIAMLALALGLGAGIFHVLTNAGLPKSAGREH